MKRLILPALVALGFSSGAMAIPTLQLGIIGGTYDSTTQTVVASAPTFSLFATLIPDAGNPISDTYALSMAVAPKVTAPAALGSFTIASATAGIASRTVNATSDMVYGTPPLETIATLLGSDPGDLASHGIFETYFAEQIFSFGGQQSALFNTQDDAGSSPSAFPGSGMYYEIFTVDVSNLAADTVIHFDLYNTLLCTKDKKQCNAAGDVDITQFAPYSHDAQSGSDGGGGDQDIPEPGSLALLGLALAGLGAMRRRFV